MEENHIYEKLNENLLNLENVENEISMIELAIYQKSLDDLKNRKIKELKELFEQKANFYNQKTEKFNTKINKNIEEYELQIDRIINAYDSLYIRVFKIMENALDNQRIAVANIVTLTEQRKSEEPNNMENTRKTIIACAEKKLNYGVIIDECKARREWCIEEAIKNIEEIFKNNIYQLQVYDDSILNKIKRNLINLFRGKSNYKRFLDSYESNCLNEIKKNNNGKILEIAATINGVEKQMEITKNQISIKYSERISA